MTEPDVTPDTEIPVELNLEDVVGLAPADLSEDQTKFLKENSENLTDEQKTIFKEVLTEKEEEIDVEKIEVETRGGKPKEKEEKSPVKTEGDEDEDIDEDDVKTIGKVVDKQLTPVKEALKELQTIKDQNEVDALIRLEPTYNKYREVALKYMAHPAYANIPAKNIMAIVASKDLQNVVDDLKKLTARATSLISSLD